MTPTRRCVTVRVPSPRASNRTPSKVPIFLPIFLKLSNLTNTSLCKYCRGPVEYKLIDRKVLGVACHIKLLVRCEYRNLPLTGI